MQAMKEIARFYKQKIPTLKRMKVKSDGQVYTQHLCAFVCCFHVGKKSVTNHNPAHLSIRDRSTRGGKISGRWPPGLTRRIVLPKRHAAAWRTRCHVEG